MEWIKWRLKSDRQPPCFEDHEHDSDFTVCSSWTEYLVVRVILITALPAVAYLGIMWRNNYYHSFGVEVKYPEKLEHLRVHVVFGILSIVVIPATVCMMYRMLCLCSPKMVLMAHFILCLPILPLVAGCYLKAIQFSTENAINTIYFNYSGHSNVGMVAILFYVIQIVAGFVMFTNKREKFAPIHSALGCVCMVVSMMTAISGYESRRFMFLTSTEVEKREIYASSMNTNLLELNIVLLIVFLSVLLGMKSMKGLFAMIYPDHEI